MPSLRHEKYRPFIGPDLSDRQWPNQQIKLAPVWCSVDLRDGNQALVEPMASARKMKMFKMFFLSVLSSVFAHILLHFVF